MNSPINQIKFRNMMLRDLEQVCEIEKSIYGENCWSRSSFVNELNNISSVLWVLEDRITDQIIGYAVLWIVDLDGHISNFAITKNRQGQKLGEQMLIYLIAKTIEWNLQKLTLEVRVSNLKAQKLYQKYGFLIEGRRPKYYVDNQEDALIMWTPNILDSNYKNFFETQSQLLISSLIS